MFPNYGSCFGKLREAFHNINLTFEQANCPTMWRAGASEQELDEFEQRHKKKLPRELRAWIRLANGQKPPQLIFEGAFGWLTFYDNRVVVTAAGLQELDMLEPFLKKETKKVSSVACLVLGGSKSLITIDHQGRVFHENWFLAESWTDYVCCFADNLKRGILEIKEGGVFLFPTNGPTCTTRGITVQAVAKFIPSMSIKNVRYVFAYHIVIKGEKGCRKAKLKQRHWIIRKGLENEEHVRGDGVIGEYPVAEEGLFRVVCL